MGQSLAFSRRRYVAPVPSAAGRTTFRMGAGREWRHPLRAPWSCVRGQPVALELHPVDYTCHTGHASGDVLGAVDRGHAPDVSGECDDAMLNLDVDVPEEVHRISVERVVHLLLDDS